MFLFYRPLMSTEADFTCHHRPMSDWSPSKQTLKSICGNWVPSVTDLLGAAGSLTGNKRKSCLFLSLFGATCNFTASHQCCFTIIYNFWTLTLSSNTLKYTCRRIKQSKDHLNFCLSRFCFIKEPQLVAARVKIPQCRNWPVLERQGGTFTAR